MIFKNRVWCVGNDKYNGFPFRFYARYNKQLKQIVLKKGIFFTETFSLEELEDMIAILKKLNKEKREDLI